ncbi:aldehyde dehydrogenase family protein [Nocardia xishanensis]|uniref:Aldehyde dehydrogenase family protein n=1 Tax=Nocardia xishanensis TaxID=238964 RepID=A0ABW7XC78_9NOCA
MQRSLRERRKLTLDIEIPGLDQQFIGGEWRESASDDLVQIVMPSTGRVIAEASAPSPTDADAAVVAARAAFDEGPWPRMSPTDRAEICARWADELEARLDTLNRAWTFESGYPRAHGEAINNRLAKKLWRRAIDLAPGLVWEEKRAQSASRDVLIQHRPMGTVLGILSYNGPVLMLAVKIIPALLAGCTVIVKPAPESALTARLIADAALAAGFPRGVISVLAAGQETSQYLVRHQGLDMIHMTGGTSVAVEVVKNTADRLARTGLELGGKSAAILLDDADLDEVLPTLVPGSIGSSAQVCIALSRILVPQHRHDEVADRLAAAFSTLRVGDPFDDSVHLGPLGNQRALARTEKMLTRAVEQGAKVLVGGRRPADLPTHLGEGFYFEPTLLTQVDATMEIAQEEVFGPLICLMTYRDIDDAIRIANGTKYGLAAAVYGKDEAVALDIANRLHAGAVAINQSGVCLTEPFGGVKQSGWGREGGAEGIFEFTQLTQVLLPIRSQR